MNNNPLRFTDPIGLEKKKPDCDQATKDCTEDLKNDGYSNKNGPVADCYSDGMGTGSAYGLGNNRANLSSNMSTCTAGSPYEIQNPEGGQNWPVPKNCENSTFQEKCR